jgi:acyl-coenzyme A synthetase/AMP-(fatty) acid ligase
MMPAWQPRTERKTCGCTTVSEYQVRQTPRSPEIAIRGEADTQRLQDELRHGLEQLGLQHPEITITTVPQLPRQDTGKIKRFLPL